MVSTKSATFVVFKWSGPFELQPSKSPDFECFRILNGQISDPHCTSKLMRSHFIYR